MKIPITDPDELPSADFPSYWTEAIEDLMDAYDEICSYSCFRIHRVTGAASVDHMAPKSRAWNRVYAWDNYRLAAGLLNARKRDFGDVLDPFDVRNGWFQLELIGFQVHPASGYSPGIRDGVQNTIDRLGLNDSSLRSAREEDALNYWEGDVSFAVLKKESPFVALELRRHGRLLAGDA